MSFGLRNADKSFHRFMNEILKHMDFAYIEDILVFSRSPHEHDQHFRILFTQLQNYGILLNHFKCVYRVPEISFQGYKISCIGSQTPRPDTRPIPLTSLSIKSDVSWECYISVGVSSHTKPHSKPLFKTSLTSVRSSVPILERPTRRGGLCVQRVPVSTWSPVPSTSNHFTRLGHGIFNLRLVSRPPTAGARHLAVPRLLLQETESATASIKWLQQRALVDLRGSEVHSSHAGGPTFPHAAWPQNAQLPNCQFL